MSDPSNIYNEPSFIQEAVLGLFVGKQIGSGASRRVYAMKDNFEDAKESVLKVEYCGNSFCNVTEYKVWKEVEHTPIAKWFAPCYHLENMGLALVQARTKVFDSEQEFNEAIEAQGPLPEFIEDIHWGNWGMLDGRLVCHDYGYNSFLKDGVERAWRKQQEDEETAAEEQSHTTTLKKRKLHWLRRK